jgi:hypothetical protein
LTLDSTQPAAVLDVSRYHTFYLKLRTDNVANGGSPEIQYPLTVTGLAAGDRASVFLVVVPLTRTPPFSPTKSGILTFSQYPDMQTDINGTIGFTYMYPVTFFGGTTYAFGAIAEGVPGDPFNLDP